VSVRDTPIVISITPEPTPEELVAITAAVTAAAFQAGVVDCHSDEGGIVSRPEPSRWARQGRRDAIRGLDRIDDYHG